MAVGRTVLLVPASGIHRDHPLTSNDGHWRQILGSFFNIQTGPFHARQRAYGGFRAVSDDTTFRHPEGIYDEYDVEQSGDGRAPGLLRVWDFSKADTRYQSEEGRLEIAGRSAEHTSELQSLMRISSAVFCLKKNKQ